MESTHRGRCWFGVPTIAVDIQLFLFIVAIGLCIHVAFQLRARGPSSSSDVVVSFGVHLAQPVGEWTRYAVYDSRGCPVDPHVSYMCQNSAPGQWHTGRGEFPP